VKTFLPSSTRDVSYPFLFLHDKPSVDLIPAIFKTRNRRVCAQGDLFGVAEMDIGPCAAGIDGTVDIVGEASLRTGAGLSDHVAELVFVHRDAEVFQVILPVAVEHAVRVHTLAEEGKLAELVEVNPTRYVLTRLQR
jgi:hypothetical protein